jgi:hypothetical protein
MMLYVIKAAITLALLYSCFFLFLSKETFHRFNRCMLVGIMLVSLVMPLFHFTTEHPTALNEEVYQMQNYIQYDTTPIVVTAQQTQGITWIQALTWIYLAGVAIMLILTLVQAISLIRFMCNGVRHTDSQGNTVILHSNDVPPFSIFRYIVMSVKDYETSRQYILTHEQEHIRLGHTYDLLLLQCMKTLMWFNPFIWFLSRDLKAVHEYEADQAVINQGIDAKSYQQLLVMKVVGNRLQPFTNNLNHGSLKKRIIMMYQKPSNRWLMLKALCAIPVAALTINTFATPTPTIEEMVNELETKEIYKESYKEEPLDSVLQRLPGVQKNADGTFTVNGKKVAKILLNGKEVYKILPDGNEGIDNEVLDVQTKMVDGKAVARLVYGTADGKEPTNNDNESSKTFESTLTYTPFDNFDSQTIDSLMQLLPGVQKNEDGSITVNGKPIMKILVDGKEVNKENIKSITLLKDQAAKSIYGDNIDKEAVVIKVEEKEDAPVFEAVEEPARYPGGEAALMQFLAQNLRYPKIAQENGIQGRILVQFIIEKDGSLSTFNVVKSAIPSSAIDDTTEKGQTMREAGKALDEEAVRVLRGMPNWTPAKQRGQVVRLKYTLPVTFRLQ